jgi:hypothetical protein
MDYLNSLSNSDNLFKFLFLGGIMMVLVAMVYPLQKKQEIEIEIVAFNKEVHLLNLEIEELSTKVNAANAKSNKTYTTLDSLSNIKGTSKEIERIKKEFNLEYNKIEIKKREQEIKLVVLDFNKRKIEVLKKHAVTYNSYSNKLLTWGIIILILGFIGWTILTVQSIKLKISEIRKNNRENP